MSKLRRGFGDVLGWAAWIQTVIDKFKNSGVIQSGDLMTKYSAKFAQMAADAAEAVKDGFQLRDLVIFGELVPEIMTIADEIKNATGEQKKCFVVDAVWVIYHSVDTGPDGKNNRIRVPGLSWLSKIGITSTEEAVERYVLKIATEMAIEAVYVRMNLPKS